MSTSTTTLPRAQAETASRLVNGTLATLAAQTNRSPVTVRTHLVSLRRRMEAPGSSRAVLAHTLLSAGHVPPPVPAQPAPELADAERLVWRTLTEHSSDEVIAETCGLSPETLRRRIAALRTKTGATDRAHLVALGHAWKILTPVPVPRGEHPSSGAAQ